MEIRTTRHQRRIRFTRRNSRVQLIPIFDEKGKQIDVKNVFHIKQHNLPRFK